MKDHAVLFQRALEWVSEQPLRQEGEGDGLWSPGVEFAAEILVENLDHLDPFAGIADIARAMTEGDSALTVEKALEDAASAFAVMEHRAVKAEKAQAFGGGGA